MKLSNELVSAARKHLASWAATVDRDLAPIGLYAFGSLIYQDGAQFGGKSDIDLVVALPEIPDGVDRVDWLERLLKHKIVLEDELGKVLKRSSRENLICSVVAVTPFEVSANIHKDGAAKFFSANAFLNLREDALLNGLPDAGSLTVSERLVQEVVRFAQKTRNSYLAVNALGAETLGPFDDGADAAPKQTMRHAAMVQYLEDDGDGHPGAEYDLDIGAERLTVLLHGRRKTLTDLNRRFNTRRNGRSAREPLSSHDQLMLAELLFDAAVQVESKAAAVAAAPNLPSTSGAHSTVVFAQRFANAFPGVRGVEWFDDPTAIRQRIGRLLEKPLVFEEGTPFWWSRGISNMPISSYMSADDWIEINGDQLNVRRVAAVNAGSYKDNFVYLEVAPLPPTGLYPHTAERIAEVENGEGAFSYYWEEFGIVDGKHLVSRSEFDDGSAVINGDLQPIHDRSVLRSRYVTPYNLIIAAGGAPIMDMSYDQRLEAHLDAMLRGADGDLLLEIASDSRRLATGRY